MTQHILFEAAGLKLAVDANLVSAVHETLPVQRVAGTYQWFLGLAVVNGKLLPVTDFGAYAGRQCCTGHTLELATNTSFVGLRIDAVKGSSDSNSDEKGVPIHDDEPFASHVLLSGRSFFAGGETHHGLDVAAMVESPAFVNIRN